ncbi:MAG: methylenetetrahydrofolate--tRNA-(uracil(54)-C(5))-methyltransferase (FADH(2)-oxidizing) TrmFO [Rickettsiales bacterium]|nr:methylenetetrahydrofolate--tRNA-(uracil(54)-C(5))-methyltransferase (FADH(2)-oxidizing) TrmFO [Rickettsiales bacterium]
MNPKIHIIGAGMAGSEAAWQAAQMGASVVIHEMRPTRMTDAHHSDQCAELVCSNSFRSDDHERNAVGLLHEEMRRCGSLLMRMADLHKVPAGGALAVDREEFAKAVTQALEAHPNISFSREEVTELPDKPSPSGRGETLVRVSDEGWHDSPSDAALTPRPLPGGEGALYIIATGPLTSPALTQSILEHTGEKYLAFFDAIAPIVVRDTVDMNIAWFQSRYDKAGPGGTGADYLNCPMNREQYYAFIEALNTGEKTEFKEWEKNTPYFEGCLPIEVMAERGRETLSFGPMKPVGLTNPHAPDEKPYAIVQLRQDNKLGTLFNMVGFQTKLKYGEQQRIFRMIPGLENAEFARLGGIHRNTFINSPTLLDASLRLKTAPHVRFAGQITGVEGYVESGAIGLLAGRFAAAELLSLPQIQPPAETALGALLSHITGNADAKTFQPMNVNFGLFPPLEARVKKGDRPYAYTSRALSALQGWQPSLKEAA